MTFSTYTFLFAFLPTLLICYYIIPSTQRTARNMVLLFFSLLFYGCSGAKYLILITASIVINYLGGLLVSRYRERGGRILFLTVAANLGLLFWFKYAGFFSGVIASFVPSFPVPEIVLPVGISFYTFQGLSYVVDVYKKDTEPQKNPLLFGLYLSLFPQLVAGPIVRYRDIAADIEKNRESLRKFSSGVVRFSIGLSKKLLLANTFGLVADQVFSENPDLLSCPVAWIGILAYHFQIYFDFSGYSDMAIGLGRMFGFEFLENFNYPYISRSVTEFWRRWHMSLSFWFRDYVYIPLGGSYVPRILQIRNIMILWMLTGLWHGADWTYILWGLWYGVWLLIEKYVIPKDFLESIPSGLRWLFTMLIVNFGWALFRADTITGAGLMMKTMLSFTPDTTGQSLYFLLEYWPEWIIGIIACLPVKRLVEFETREDGFVRRWGPLLLAAVLLVLSYVSLITGGYNPFLYFQF